MCFVGLPPAVLGPNVLSKGVETGPTGTQIGPTYAQIIPRLPGHAYGRQNYSEWVTASRHNSKAKKKNTLSS